MARRVNKKFLTILSLIIMGSLLTAVAVPMVRKKGDAAVLWQRVDQQVAIAREQKTLDAYQAAKEAFGKAFRADNNNLEGIIKFGDLLHEMAPYDLEEVGKDVGAWERALEIDPRYVPALERLINAYMDLCRLQPVPEAFKRLTDRAATLQRIQPDNARAQAYEHIGIIGSWLAGSSTRESEIEVSVARLIDLAKRVPEEVDIPWFVARANLRLASNRASDNDTEAARNLREVAVKVFEDAMKAQPDSAALAYRYFQIQLNLVDPKLEGEAEKKEVERLQKLIENARALAKPADPDYVDINLGAAHFLRQRRPAEGEKLVAALLQERPDDQRIRFAMVEYWRLQPDKRQAAIEMLSKPVGDDSNRRGFRALTIRDLEFRRLTELAELRLSTYDDTPLKDRPALREAINQNYRSALALYSEEDRPQLLKLKGKLLLLEGTRQSNVEAVRALRAAYDKYERRGIIDIELTHQLARLYYAMNESGQYKTLLTRLLDARPNAHQIRKGLVPLLLRERLWEEANKHIEVLEKNLKDDPDTARLRVGYLLYTGDLKTVQGMVDKMPETLPSQKLVKVACYQVLGDHEKAEKILLPMSRDEAAKNYEESNATQMLVRLYLKANRKDDAARVAEEVLAKNAREPSFKILLLAARDQATPEQLAAVYDDIIDGMADPVARDLQRYWMNRQANKPAAELENALLALEQRVPNDGRVLETLFNHAIDYGNIKLAETVAQKLEKLNYDQADGLYFRTRLHMARRNADAALNTASQLSRRLPEFSRTWVIMGQAQQLNGQYESAVASFNKALEMQLENFEALRGLVECHIELRQIPEASKLLERGSKSQNPAYFVEIAKRLQEFSGDPKSVTAAREADLKARPEILGVWLALIDNYVRCADSTTKTDPAGSKDYLAKAEAKLKEALAKWPDESPIYGRLADVAVRAGKPADGLKALETLAARDKWKDKPEPQLMMASYYMSLPPARADASAQPSFAGNIRSAEAALQEALKKAPGNIAVSQRIVDFYLQTNQSEKAIALLTEMTRSSNEPSLKQRLIELMVAMSDPRDPKNTKLKEAEQLLQSSLQSKPDDVWLISLMGFVRMSGKDYRSAGEYFDRAIKIKPDYATAFYWRGVMKNSSGDVNGAMADFEQARNLMPQNMEYRVALADLYSARNMADEVVQELEAAINLAPHRNDLRGRLLQVHLDRKQWTSAEKILNEVKQNPNLSKDARWWKLESQMWQLRGDPLKAIDATEQALKINPSDQESIQNLLKILIDSGNPVGFDRVIILTDSFMKGQTARPWWMHNFRGIARASLKQSEEAVKEFEQALFAVDASATPPIPLDPETGRPVRAPNQAEIVHFETNADMSANTLVRSMIRHVGPQATEAKLKDRRAPRWEIELSQVYMAQKDWQRMVNHLNGLLEESRFLKLARHQRMQVLRISGQAFPAASGTIPGTYERGIELCKRYIDELELGKAPTFTQIEALNNLASLIAENPKGANPTQAMQYSKRAYEIMKDNAGFFPHVADTHGWILVLCGQTEEGIDILKSATDPKEGDRIPAEAYYHLGEAYLKKSLNEDALQNLERAVQMFDDAVKKGVFVDPELKNKATAAIARAKGKTAAAINP